MDFLPLVMLAALAFQEQEIGGDGVVIISQGALLLGTAVVGSLTTAIGILFRGLLAAKDQQIAQWNGLYQSEHATNQTLVEITHRLTSAGDKALNLAHDRRGQEG